MTGMPRLLVLLFGGVLIVIGSALVLRWPHAGGWPPIVVGALIVASTFAEGRYRPGDDTPPGIGWAPTGEVFRDVESGGWLRVWQHRRNGARRYLPCGGPPAT